jgi:hypothetical protein
MVFDVTQTRDGGVLCGVVDGVWRRDKLVRVMLGEKKELKKYKNIAPYTVATDHKLVAYGLIACCAYTSSLRLHTPVA